MTDLFSDFSGSDYEGEQNSFPFIQLVSKDEIERSGLFISQETADRVQFQPDETWSRFNMKYKGNTNATPGYLCQNPRFVIVARSKPVIWMDKTPDFVGIYSKASYNNQIHILKTRYLVMLLDADNKLLTNSPVQLTTKGAFNGSFGAALTGYQSTFNAVLAAHSADKKPRNEKFFSMVVIQLHLKLEPRGKEDTLCCVVDKILSPTVENIRGLFLGTEPEMKELLEGYHSSTKKVMQVFEGGGSTEGVNADGSESYSGGTNGSKKVDLQDIEILPPTALSEDEVRAKCAEIFMALGYGENNGRQAIEIMTKTTGIGKLSLMNRQAKEQTLFALYDLISKNSFSDDTDKVPF